MPALIEFAQEGRQYPGFLVVQPVADGALILDDPAPHIGRIYNLTGFESADLDHYARAYSEALGRTIRYRNVPLRQWTDGLRQAGVTTHVINHLAVMAGLHAQGRYDRMTDDFLGLTSRTV